MKKPHIPTCVRALSKEEVAEVWLSLKAEADKAEHLIKASTTSDGEGVRWLGRDQFNRATYRKDALEHARHVLLDRCDRKRKR